MQKWINETTVWLVETWGLNKELAYRIAYILLWGLEYDMPVSVISGWRDPDKQRQLQKRWDSGDRSGLAVRPASSSKHTVTDFWGNPDSMAVDLAAGSDKNLKILGFWAKNYAGLKWGGDFRTPDLVHFYL